MGHFLEGDNMDSLSGKLAAFITGLKYKSLPSEVVQKAKLCLMDTLGAALAGSKMPEALIAKRLASPLLNSKYPRGVNLSRILLRSFRSPHFAASLDAI